LKYLVVNVTISHELTDDGNKIYKDCNIWTLFLR